MPWALPVRRGALGPGGNAGMFMGILSSAAVWCFGAFNAL